MKGFVMQICMGAGGRFGIAREVAGGIKGDISLKEDESILR